MASQVYPPSMTQSLQDSESKFKGWSQRRRLIVAAYMRRIRISRWHLQSNWWRTNRISLDKFYEFSSCCVFVSITVSKTHQFNFTEIVSDTAVWNTNTTLRCNQLAQDGGECLALRPCHFTLAEGASGTQWIGDSGAPNRYWRCGEEKNLALRRIEPGPSSV
jgi:hypothetical protein